MLQYSNIRQKRRFSRLHEGRFAHFRRDNHRKCGRHLFRGEPPRGRRSHLTHYSGLPIVSLLVGARVLARASHERRVRPAPAHNSDGVETVLVIGLNKLAELYLQCLAELDTGRMRIAGLLGERRRVGLSVHSHPVLGTPDQVASTLRRLELHGVFVDRILVALPRDDLSLALQDALSQIPETTTICLEYLVERMGIQSPPAGTAVAKPTPKETVSSTVAAVNLAFAEVPYHLVKQAMDIVGSAVLVITLAPLFCSWASWWRRMWGCRWYSGNSGRDCVDDHLSFTNFELWQMLTVPTGNGNLITRGFQPSVISSGGVA
jgi:hypothetical protein